MLWSRGPSTVREVHDALQRRPKALGYTSVLKLMQIMTAKGLVTGATRSNARTSMKRGARGKTKRQFAVIDAACFPGLRERTDDPRPRRPPQLQNEIEELRSLLDEYERKQK